MGCSIVNPALSLLKKHLVIGQRQKAHNFSAFHWSPHDSLVSTGQRFGTTRVAHLPKRTETSLITESDQIGPNHQLLQLYTARTACSDSDQAVRAVHSCNSWFPCLIIAEFLSSNTHIQICRHVHQLRLHEHVDTRTNAQYNITVYSCFMLANS